MQNHANYVNGKLLFFLSCNAEESVIESTKEEGQIVSIYHVCGNNPWLLIYKPQSIQNALQLNRNYPLRITHMSIAPVPINAEEPSVVVQNGKIKFWVFISAPKNISFETILSFTEESKERNELVIAENYELFGSYNYVVKLYARNINAIDSFLTKCLERGINTSTKCVLSTLKEDGRRIDENEQEIKDRVRKIKSDREYILTRIMTNIKSFIEMKRDEQITHLMSAQSALAMAFKFEHLIPDIDFNKVEYCRDELEHPNQLIDRYAIKLSKEGWSKALFFFKARRGKKEQLQKALLNNLLGVGIHHFSRKLYHETGRFDFFVPFDCKNSEEADKVFNDFSTSNHNLIEESRNVICSPDIPGEATPLHPLDIHFIKALLINATNMSTFLQWIRTYSAPIVALLQSERMPLAEVGFTPREDYLRRSIHAERRLYDSQTVRDHLSRFSFEGKGVQSTIEIKDGALIQALFRFYSNSPASKTLILENIKRKETNYEIIVSTYKPLNDPLRIICIFTVKNLDELKLIYHEFKNLCDKIEFDIIFHQNFYSKAIEKDIKCRPCFYPERKQNCGKCIRYILPRVKDRILNIHFEQEIKRNIKCSLVGINMDLAKYCALEARLRLEDGDRIFSELQQRRPEKTEKYEQLKQVYHRIEQSGFDPFRDGYKKGVIKILEDSDSDIIVFPEYTIPQSIYEQIKNLKFKKQESVIVLGSHIDEEGFNTCPILFVKNCKVNEVYLCYRNWISPLPEEQIINLMKHEGTAHLKFHKTTWGNLFILLCYDTFSACLDSALKEVDFFLVPSFNPSKALPSNLEGEPNRRKLIFGYANTPDIPDDTQTVPSRFVFPRNDGLDATPFDIKPFHTEQWPSPDAQRNKMVRVFSDVTTTTRGNTGDFIFTVQDLVVHNLIELDIRRNYRGGQ